MLNFSYKYLNLPIPEIKSPIGIELHKIISQIEGKPPSIDEKEQFWNHLENFNMILCEKGCYTYICKDEIDKICPYMI